MDSINQRLNGTGIDASSGGFFATIINKGNVKTAFDKSFENLIAKIGEVEPILVDVPIGLPVDSRRDCDIATKKLLGCRGNSVFYAPSEAALQCSNYDDANSAHRKAVGNGLSQQAYHLGKAIRQVSNHVSARYDGRIRESHPEVCFLALNDQPVAWSKSTKRGRRLRLELLDDVYDYSLSIYNEAKRDYLRKQAARDDIIDSMVLSWAASQPELGTLPANVEPDEPRIYHPILTDNVTDLPIR